MAEPATPGDARRQGLRRTRWVAAGASVGAAVILTGTIAVVNAAPSNSSDGTSPQGSVSSDDGYRGSDAIDNREYEDAQPFTPQQQTPQPAPQFTPAPQTRTRGS